MSGPLRDLFHAWRGLRQKPGFFVAALLTLAIGIGANVTIFSLVNGISLRPMPFGDRTDRLVTIHPTHRLELSTSPVGATRRSRTRTSSISGRPRRSKASAAYLTAQLRVERR